MKLARIVALALTLMATSAVAQEFTLRVGSVAPEGTPWYKIVMRLKQRIEKDSGGRIKVKPFLGQALGGEKSIARRCKDGTLEMLGVSSGALATLVPELNAFELPYLFDSYKQADRAVDATTELTREILARSGFHLYIWSENGFRDFATKDKFVKMPSDLSGMKMRAQESFVHTEMYKALGAKPDPIAVPNVPESLASGVVSGYDNTLLYSFAGQWYKSIKYVTESHHIYQPAVIAYNKAWFDKLPADLQKIVMADVQKETENGRERIRAMNSELTGLFKKEGIQFYTPTASERAAMKAATKGVYQEFRKRTGDSGSRLLDAILKAL